MRKYDYKTLFNELYDYYIQNGDNDASWTHIIRALEKKGFVSCQLHSSKIHYCLYTDCYAYVCASIPQAFRLYRPESNATIYTWSVRLIRQAIWRYIKDRVNQDRLEGYTTDDYSEYDRINFGESVEEIYCDREESDSINDKLDYILRCVLRNDVYFDVYSLKKGLWGNEKISREESIASYLGLTLKTVRQAVVDNKMRMSAFKRYLAANNNDISNLTKESFEEFRKSL